MNTAIKPPNPFTSESFCRWVKKTHNVSIEPGSIECRLFWEQFGTDYLKQADLWERT